MEHSPDCAVEPTPEPPTARNLYHVEAFDEANKRIGGFAVFGPDMGTALAKAASNIEVKLRPSQPRMTVTLLSAMKPTGAPAPCVWREDGPTMATGCGVRNSMLPRNPIKQGWKACPYCKAPLNE